MRWPWDRFVTLTFNRPGLNSSFSGVTEKEIFELKDKLKEWDGRMQRRVVGSNWQKISDHRMFCTYTLEKSDSNPHWHGLVHFFDVDEPERTRQAAAFDEHASTTWAKLVPAGDVVVEPIYNQSDAIRYVGKSLSNMINFENWVPPDEFGRP